MGNAPAEGYTDVGALYDDTQMVLLAATRPWPTVEESLALPPAEQGALARQMDDELMYQDRTLLLVGSDKLCVAENRRNPKDPEACWFPVFVAKVLRVPPKGQHVTVEDLEVELYVPGSWETHLRLLGARARTVLHGRL